jgi:hypothetical protein
MLLIGFGYRADRWKGGMSTSLSTTLSRIRARAAPLMVNVALKGLIAVRSFSEAMCKRWLFSTFTREV